MQVTHTSDRITHAVIGGEEKIQMKVNADAAFFHMLSDTLYSDKPMAVVREVLCNAWDAHIEAENTHTPIKVYFSEDNEFVVEDFGKGIPKDKMGDIYGTLGGSTKQKNSEVTGGFGLGCKSPFALVDSFQVESSHEGVRTIYRISKSSAERNGLPTITPMLSIPCTKPGLKVSIPLDGNRVSRNTMLHNARMVVRNGGMLAEVSGNVVPTLPIAEAKNGFLIARGPHAEHMPGSICVLYGNVIYPVSDHDDYEYLYDECKDWLRLSGDYNSALVLKAQPNTIEVTPSRESLSMVPTTKNTLHGLLEKFHSYMKNNLDGAMLQLLKHNNEKALESAQWGQLMQQGAIPVVNQASLNEFLKPGDIIGDTILTAAGVALWIFSVWGPDVVKRLPNGKAILARDRVNRVAMLRKCPEVDQVLLGQLLRVHRKCPTKRPADSTRNFVSAAFRKIFMKDMLMGPVQSRRFVVNHSRDMTVLTSNRDWMSSAALPEFHPIQPLLLYSFQKRIVVLTHSSKDVESRILKHPLSGEYFKKGVRTHFFTYVTPRSAKTLAEVRNHFNSLENVALLDLTKEIEYIPPAERIKTKKVKMEGFATLRTARKTDYFSQELAKTGTEHRTDKPVAFSYLFSKSNTYHARTELPGFRSAVAVHILKVWGDKVAIAHSIHDEKKFIAMGLPTLEEYVQAEMLKFVRTNKKALLKYVGSSWAAAQRVFEPDDEYGSGYTICKHLLETNEWRDALGIKTGLSPELVAKWNLLCVYRDNVRRYTTAHKELESACEFLDTAAPTAKVRELVNTIKDYPTFNLLCSNSTIKFLKQAETKEETFHMLQTMLKRSKQCQKKSAS
ncbi:N4 gp33-like protein [Pseudomonas phage LUZ7]|uniref:N4 gp33-like protein n=1 Tax=Pseudomonas phage LUZ7 TaxID=655097 RepID=C8ZKE0_9CAUD|nr:RIIA lysis inhibitor [Pseudomonas phage LUZ7]CAZ66187.1 N4 gp33-like protein [Pseudomonas phage LUZ7]